MLQEELKKNLNKDLKNNFISSNVLLNNLLIINEEDRKSSSYVDSKYFPIYYHIGKYLQIENLFEINPNLGYSACCYFKSNKKVSSYIAVQDEINKDVFYPKNLFIKNIKKNYKNYFNFSICKLFNYDFDVCKNFDLVFINLIEGYDKCFFCLDKCFKNIKDDSYLIVDRVKSDIHCKNAYENYCKINSIDNFILETRYGTGIIWKG